MADELVREDELWLEAADFVMRYETMSHITDGRHGSWEGWSDPRLLREIDQAWFEHRGYVV